MWVPRLPCAPARVCSEAGLQRGASQGAWLGLTVVWLWLHRSFPGRPREAKAHRWPSGWHFPHGPALLPAAVLPPLSALVAPWTLQRNDSKPDRHYGWDTGTHRTQSWLPQPKSTIYFRELLSVCSSAGDFRTGPRMGGLDAAPSGKIPRMRQPPGLRSFCSQETSGDIA